MKPTRTTSKRRTLPFALAILVAGAVIGGCLLIQSSQPAEQPATQPVATARSHGEYRQYIYGGLPKTAQELSPAALSYSLSLTCK